jgi:catechol 2,3-dioxygenase-like lactoylglutathione lyase family enzyme
VPTFAFEVTAAKLMAVVEVASAEGVDFDGPIRRRDVPYALESVYFNDHDGNHFHVYVPRTAHRKRAADWSGQIIRAGYVEIEAPDLDASVLFYEEVLGAELVGYSQDERKNLLQAHMRLPSSHVLTLSQVHEARWGPMLSQVLDGPSMAFSVPWTRWAGVSTHLDRLGVGESAPPEAGTNRRRRVAVDPAGNVFEYVAEWIE